MNMPAMGSNNVERTLAEYFYMNNIGIVKQFNRLSEKPAVWKHMCIHSGINNYSPLVAALSEFDVVEYIFCPLCGAVTYYYEKSY